MKIILFLFLATSLYGREAIGKVVALQGSAYSGMPEKKERRLAPGVAVFSEETMRVAAGSTMQVRFADGSILNLNADSQYQVVEQTSSSQQSKASKGSFRYLSGQVGKDNPDGVSIQTPTVTIGLRGTLIDVAISPNGQVAISCPQGTIAVSNAQGSILVGAGAPTLYATGSGNQSPQASASMPPALNNVQFNPPPGGIPINLSTSPTGQTQVQVETGSRIRGGC